MILMVMVRCQVQRQTRSSVRVMCPEMCTGRRESRLEFRFGADVRSWVKLRFRFSVKCG